MVTVIAGATGETPVGDVRQDPMGTAVEDRKGHDRRYSVNDSRIRELGYEPLHSFDEGLAETVQWYRDNEDWWRPLKERAAIKMTR